MELSSWSAALQKASTERPKPDCKLSYGTAGFRTNANLLQSTVFRCGVLMALRSLKTSSVTGICITASHNPAPDNGVKLVDPSGEMLSQDYEGFADELANAETSEALVGVVKRFIETEGIDMGQAERGKVLLAFDTRPSGGPLAEDAAAGAGSLGVSVELLGMMTTPQLHWAVMRRNQGLESSEDAYYKHIAGAFGRLSGPTFSTGQERRKLHVDCANGVGALKLEKLKPYVVRLGLDLSRRSGPSPRPCAISLSVKRRAPSMATRTGWCIFIARPRKGTSCCWTGIRLPPWSLVSSKNWWLRFRET
jgi:phosphoacetylglucosamine mutase